MRLIFLFIPLVFLMGCLQTRDPNSLTLQIRSSQKTNHGTPLYFVVKETSINEFLMDDYHEIASQSFWKETNEHQLLKKILIPGKTIKIDLPIAQKEKQVGLYFIFTNPGESWKCIIDNPQSKKVKILLGENQCEAVNIYQP